MEGEVRYLEAFVRCLSAPNPDVTIRMLEALIERGQVNATSMAKELNVNYSKVLRSLNTLMAAGIVIVFSKKGTGRGRPRKMVALDRDGLLAAFDRCRALLGEGRKSLGAKLKEMQVATIQQTAEA